MALPSSGSLSLSQIQGEWGGSNPISLSEYYRGSLPTGRTNYGTIPYSGAIDIGDFYGSNAASANWTSSLTMGNFKNIVYGYASGAYGSLSDTTINTFGNRTIQHLFWNGQSAGLTINNAPNSGWTRIKIHNTNFYRSQANSFNSSVGQWMWNTTTNPFGTTTTGAVRTITFVI